MLNYSKKEQIHAQKKVHSLIYTQLL